MFITELFTVANYGSNLALMYEWNFLNYGIYISLFYIYIYIYIHVNIYVHIQWNIIQPYEKK